MSRHDIRTVLNVTLLMFLGFSIHDNNGHKMVTPLTLCLFYLHKRSQCTYYLRLQPWVMISRIKALHMKDENNDLVPSRLEKAFPDLPFINSETPRIPETVLMT